MEGISAAVLLRLCAKLVGRRSLTEHIGVTRQCRRRTLSLDFGGLCHCALRQLRDRGKWLCLSYLWSTTMNRYANHCPVWSKPSALQFARFRPRRNSLHLIEYLR